MCPSHIFRPYSPVMDASHREECVRAAQTIMELLCTKQYAQIERLTNSRRLSEHDIRVAIDEYGRSIAPPPPEAFDSIDVVEVTAARDRTFSVRMPCYTLEEGRSDLSIELEITTLKVATRIALVNITVF